MTPEQIIELAKESSVYVSVIDKTRAYLDEHRLINFAKLVESATREECAKLVEQDLYPDDSGKPYTKQYNFSIKVLADKFRSGT